MFVLFAINNKFNFINSKLNLSELYFRKYKYENKVFYYSSLNPKVGSTLIDTSIVFKKFTKCCDLINENIALDSMVYFMKRNYYTVVLIEINISRQSSSDTRYMKCQMEKISEYLLKNGIPNSRFFIWHNFGLKPIINNSELHNLSMEDKEKLMRLNDRVDIKVLCEKL